MTYWRAVGEHAPKGTRALQSLQPKFHRFPSKSFTTTRRLCILSNIAFCQVLLLLLWFHVSEQTTPRNDPNERTATSQGVPNRRVYPVRAWSSMPHKNATVSRSTRIVAGPVGNWYRHRHVCVNHEDGSTRHSFNEEYIDVLKAFELDRQTEPFRPTLIDWQTARAGSSVTVLQGTSTLVQCWRNSGPNPVHFWFAYANLLRILFFASPFPIHTVLFHQCGDPRRLGSLFELIANTSVLLGQRRGFFDSRTQFISVNAEQHERDIFCMDDVEVNYDLISFNDVRLVQRIKEEVHAHMYMLRMVPTDLISHSGLRVEQDNFHCHACKRELRFGLYERPISDKNRRLIVNHKEVLALFKEISHQPPTVFHVSRADPLPHTIRIFNSFDIIVSSHGSHYVNFLFTKSNRTALIEVFGTEVFLGGEEEDFWSGLVPYHQTSWPHMSPDKALQHLIDTSSRQPLSDYERQRVKNADLLLNISHLRYAVSKAVNYVCPCNDERMN